MKTQHVYREIFEVEEDGSTPPKANPQVDQLTETVIEWITYELVG